MYRILTASKDTYITNKITANSLRVTDANVGKASTIDLFKLYDESVSGSAENPIEMSRGLIKFNFDTLNALTSSTVDLNSNNFKATLKMFDVYGGQTTPSNFKLIVFPLSMSFDEGNGRDVVKFGDLDAANYITASIKDGTAVAWNQPGGHASGSLSGENLDVIVSGTIAGPDGSSYVNLTREQMFTVGSEDLALDVTKIVSATVSGQIPDHGFLLAYSASYEKNTKSYFVKRFASRNTTNYLKRPQIVIQYDDSIQDHHNNFYFGTTGSVFLNNDYRSSRRDLTSGSADTKVSGKDCLHLLLTSGSDSLGTLFKKTVTGSQHYVGENAITGIYSASFAISEFESGTIFHHVKSAGSASFTAIWSSIDETVPFLTSSLTIFRSNRSAFDNDPKRLLVSVTNLQSSYRFEDKVRFRVFVEDIDRDVVFRKLPFETESQIFTKMYYRVRDVISDEVVIPFDKKTNSTILSTDSNGMYFDFYMDSLSKGRLYTIDFLIRDLGEDLIFTDVAAKFRVED